MSYTILLSVASAIAPHIVEIDKQTQATVMDNSIFWSTALAVAAYTAKKVIEGCATLSDRKKLAAAIFVEINNAEERIAGKMQWIEKQKRPQNPAHLFFKYNKSFIGMNPGERFECLMPFWSENKDAILKRMSATDIAAIYNKIALIQQFEQKYKDLAQCFELDTEDNRVMACACFDDLKKLQAKIHASEPDQLEFNRFEKLINRVCGYCQPGT